ncbi:MAG: penicillin-binding protein 1C [Prevotellaceae bacterium]|jgi:penicillin-binding protein 1C|nr:penicillin-binding protein 1C [Prevotellaceae bacterium]
MRLLRKYWYVWLCVTLGIWYYFSLPEVLFHTPVSTLLESADGQLLGAKIAADGQWRFPPSDTVSEKYEHCVIAYEDKRFMQHSGVDAQAICRALWHNLRAGKIVEGGSTISMQVVRLMRRKPRTVKEKIIECVLATRLECRYSKREILQLYRSHAPFGSNVVGIEAASWRYFGRSPRELSWAEAAMLAVLPNAPSLIHPGRNRSALLKKRNDLLDEMAQLGWLSEADKRLAQLETLPEKPLPLPMSAPHALERLAKSHEGEHIVGTLHASLQQRAAQVVNDHAKQWQGNEVHNAAALIIDNRSSSVLAYVGNVANRHDKAHGEDVDIITSWRSTGSILKPFLYAALLDEGELLPGTLLPDIPVYISGFAPQNFNKTFDGATPAYEALQRSLNIPAVHLLQQFGVGKFHAWLKHAGLTSLHSPPDHYGLALILGGAEASLWDVTAIYAAMSRTLNHYLIYNGKYSAADWQKPTFTPHEAVATPLLHDEYTLSAAACWQLFEILSEVQRPEEEAVWKDFPSSRRVAWKTGTSYGNRDAWAVGTTPDYTIGVWAGNANGEGRPMLTGTGYAAPLLFDLFNLLPPTSWYKQPFDEMTQTAVCRQSGHRATELCEVADSVWIAGSGLDSPLCPYHILVHLDRHERYRVTADCEEVHKIVTRPWFVLPPAQEWYYRMKHFTYKPLPPVAPHCAVVAQQPMALIYPANGVSIVLAKQMNGTLGKLDLQATHRRRNAVIYWHLDEEYLGATQYFHNMPMIPTSGTHTLTLVDEEGMGLKSWFVVEE